MRIVNIEDYFIPDAGYQINIMSKYLAFFGHEVWIVTSKVDGIKKSAADFFGTENIEKRDAAFTKKNGVRILRVKPLIDRMVNNRIIQSGELFRVVNSLNPDVVYVHGNDTFTGIRYLLKKHLPYPLVTDSHMLSMATLNRFHRLFADGYRRFVTPHIIKNNIPVIRTQDDPYVERAFGIPLSQAPWISYGSDTLLFHPDPDVKREFRKENGIGDDDFVAVYTGKLDEPKGGKLLAETFRKKFDTKKNVVLVAVGGTAGEYGKEVEKIFSESENRVIRFQTQKYCDLPRFYQAADLSVFARQCSLSFYDAQACGLPVLSEDNNINVDRCSHKNGWNFKAGDVDDFREHIVAAVNMPKDDYRDISENAYQFITKYYNYENKAREYEKIIIDTYERFLKGEKNA